MHSESVLPLQTPLEWQDVFILAGVIHICGVIFYAIFASGELEPWAEPPKDIDQMQMEQTQNLTGPPGAHSGAYYDATGQTRIGYNDTSAWNDSSAPYAASAWDGQQAAPGAVAGSNNPFGNAPVYDPNTAWGNDSAASGPTANGYSNNYGSMNNNNNDTFYETRAQYIQPANSQY